tara:strand:+ start:29182 stop:29433 length:252 start_codon:yes stop_codon:yes gene_type:complete
MQKTFLELLQEQHQWPTDYLFKFVVPKKNVAAFCQALDLQDFEAKESSGGKYQSLTFRWKMHTAEEVVKVYQKAAGIEGVISL